MKGHQFDRWSDDNAGFGGARKGLQLDSAKVQSPLRLVHKKSLSSQDLVRKEPVCKINQYLKTCTMWPRKEVGEAAMS